MIHLLCVSLHTKQFIEMISQSAFFSFPALRTKPNLHYYPTTLKAINHPTSQTQNSQPHNPSSNRPSKHALCFSSRRIIRLRRSDFGGRAGGVGGWLHYQHQSYEQK